ncbi:hypothetical protein EsH8_III_000980 [Colletotrichum jinshuiense]
MSPLAPKLDVGSAALSTAGINKALPKKKIRYSKNWSGAVNSAPPSGYFAAAGMKFTVPRTLGPDIAKAETDYFATGVTVEINKTISNEVAYVPWYEWWPNIAMKLDIAIGGGDEVEVEVVMFNETSGKILLWNKSRGEWVARTLQAPRPDAVLAGSSVEWIVEDFALSEGGNVPFGDFDVIELRDCKAHTSTEKILLHVPGYRLVYNSTYCNGVKDPEGARRRDCVFDPVHGGWVPRLCHDEDLYKQFTTQNDWDWYLDENRTIPIAQDAVWNGEGGGRTWTKDDFHFRHCEFIIKTLFKNGIGKAKPLGFKVLDVGHLEHCLDRLINSNTPEIRNAYTEEVVWTKSAECYERVDL